MTPETLPTAAVVIVNYNTPDEVPACLDALAALVYPRVEILVVDNGGDGGTPVDLRDRYPAVRVLRPSRNLGFAGGANFGWAATEAKVLAVLNPDVRVTPGWLQALVGGMRDHADRRAGVVGGKLLYPDGRVQHAGGTFAFPAASTALIGRGEPDGPAFAADREVPYVTGGALAISRDAYTRLGGFDAGYWPAYFEDLDLCTRAWDAGFSVWYIAGAVAQHAESLSLAHGGPAYFRAYQRNRLRYVLRHYDRGLVATAFAPAEEARLRGDLAPDDRASSLTLYGDALALAALLAPPGAAPPPLPPADPGPPAARQVTLAGQVAEVMAGWRVQPQPFTSRIPGLAWLRTRLNNLWTRPYLDPILAQQVEYNAALARAVRELAAQVSGLEAALLVRAGLDDAGQQTVEDAEL
jgi:GT2 family glycosyltransferase